MEPEKKELPGPCSKQSGYVSNRPVGEAEARGRARVQGRPQGQARTRDVVHSSYLGEAADNVRVADARREDATLLKAGHAPQLKRTVVTRGHQHWLTGRSFLARLVGEEQRGDARRLVVPGRSNAVKSATLKAARSSTKGGGWTLTDWGPSSWEYRAAESRQAHPEDVQKLR